MFWDQITSPQLDQVDRNTPVIFPISATEQHGAHLPLATDRMIGQHFCSILNNEMEDRVLILPMLGIGCSEHHKDFCGSLSLEHVHFMHQLTDIANCIVHYGFKNILVLNSHGGNQAIGQTFIESFGYRNPGVRIALATWWKIALRELIELNESGPRGAGHAGELETSLMLLIAPELVHLDQIKPKSNIPTFDWAEGDMLYGADASLYRTMKEMTGEGVFGDASHASKEKGQQITKVVVNKLLKMITDLST